MAIFLNPDNANFNEAVHSKIYVDKTGLIEYTNSVLSTTAKFICNSRPRRFGKSMTADMLCAYYSKGCDSRELFQPYTISSCSTFEKYINQYDVIHIDVQWCKDQVENINDIVNYIKESCMHELQNEYCNIDYNGIISLSGTLSKINDETGHRFVVIIDEWDVLIRDNADNKKLLEEYIDFLKGLFKGSQPSRYIALAYLTGILPIKRTMTQSALNNFDEYTMLNPGPLASFIGFTEGEVKGLSNKYNIDFDRIKKWYNGYYLNRQHVYNPKAVVSLFTLGVFQSYWTQTSSYESIHSMIKMNFDGLKEAVLEMLSGNEVKMQTTSFQNDMVSFKNMDDVLTALVHLGYLGYNQKDQTCYIPNKEVMDSFFTSIKNSDWNATTKAIQNSRNLLDATFNMNETKVADYIEQAHLETSHIQYNDENALSYTIDLAYYAARDYYTVIRELPTGKGLADLAFIPKTDKPAMLVELKWNKNVNTAITQIKEKKYPSVLEKYKDNLLLVGIAYDKKTRKHICKIERL